MPRAFSADERELIQGKLLEAGIEQFSGRGLRRTNVADLARAAGIAKGSFYLFFPSKESLLLALLWDEQGRLRRSLTEVGESQGPPRERIERLLRLYLDAFAASPCASSLGEREDAEALARALPAGALDRAQADEDAHFLGVFQSFQDAGELTPLEPDVLVGLLRVLRSIAASRDQIGVDRFAKTADLLVAAWTEYLAW